MKKILFIIFSFLFIPFSLHAATLYFDVPKEISKGGEFLVNVKLDTGADKVNAISGMIVLDKSSLSISKIYDGDSSILLWIERPSLDTKEQTISFSGLTPGGFQGNRTVFSFSMKSLVSGNFVIGSKDVVVLKNDGLGTAVKVDAKNSRLLVNKNVSTSTVDIVDNIPPEVFYPQISSSPEMFDGRPFISFGAVDKGVGVDYYEYASTWFWSPFRGSWTTISSPFVIPTEDQYKSLFIRAIDRNGNNRMSYTASFGHYVVLITSAILILLFLCVLLFFTRRYLRSRS